jgi:Zn-dependent peptidase ImmA (M78 family)/transcriptional regulator with XRE-family HTH domain
MRYDLSTGRMQSMLGERIRQARLAAGLTLRDLASMVGVSRSAIDNYEHEADRPRQSTLLAIGRALAIPTERLLLPQPVSLSILEFRKRASLPIRKQEQIEARVRTELEPYIDLVELLSADMTVPYDSSVAAQSQIAGFCQIESFADTLRQAWKLGLGPIRNVVETVEGAGVRVITDVGDERFDELACMANGKYPVVVVKALPEGKGDRQRFNVLHGLGHLLLCPGPDMDKEKMCHRFAAAMLAPQDAVRKKLGPKRRTLDLDYELPQLKKEFGLSLSAWVNRAYDLGIIGDDARKQLFISLAMRGWKTNEPVPIELEAPSSFRLLVHRAKAEGIISPVKAAEYLGTIHRKLLPDIKESDIPESAVSAYAAGGSLDAWEDMGSGGKASAAG